MSLLRTGLGRRVNHVLIFSPGERKAAYIASVERHSLGPMPDADTFGRMLRGYASVWWLQRLGRVDCSQSKSSQPASSRRNQYRRSGKCASRVLLPTVERCAPESIPGPAGEEASLGSSAFQRRDDHLRPEHIPRTCGAVLSIVRFKNIPSGTGAKRPRIRYEDAADSVRIYHVFHGALPVAQSSSSLCLSRNVSIGCQKPRWK
jgi:hypothetical protein